MSYYVIAPDGQKYGPAELTLLNQWVVEGRISSETLLEDATTGARMLATQLPGLALPTAPSIPPVQAAPPQPSPPQPTSFDIPGVAPGAGPQPDWSRAPGPTLQSPYPRGGYALSPDVVPDELRGKWNWGAFFLSWIWGLNHKAYLTLLVFAAGAVGAITHEAVGNLAVLGLCIWFGMAGNEWAWKSGRFQTIEHFRQVQKAWAIWGLVIAVLGFVVCGALAVLGLAIAGMSPG